MVRPCPENAPRPHMRSGEVSPEGLWVLIATARDQFAAVFDGADFYVGDVKLRVIPEPSSDRGCRPGAASSLSRLPPTRATRGLRSRYLGRL